MYESPSKNRVIAYIDGFNLYFGMKSRGWNQFFWLDPWVLAETLITGGRSLEAVKYFTARVKAPDDKRARQSAYLDAVRASTDAEIVLGQFSKKPRQCFSCGATWNTFEEKMTDSAIATHLVADAFLNAFDTAILVGGDTDIVPAIKMVKRHFPTKRLEAWFPPRRKNQYVADCCDDAQSISGAHLEPAQMPDRIEIQEGVSVTRPGEWR